MSFFRARASAQAQIKTYITTGAGSAIRGKFSGADRQKHSVLLELVTAYKLGLCMWGQIPPADFYGCTSEQGRKIFIRNGKVHDFGIDCANLENSHVAQVKWYCPGGYVTYNHITNFKFLSDIVGARRRTLVMSSNVRVSPAVDVDISNIDILVIEDAEIDRICALSLGGAERNHYDGDIIEYVEGEKFQTAPLYLWQVNALAALVPTIASLRVGTHPKWFATADIACGAGKSRLVVELINYCECRSAVVFVPNTTLLHQYKGEFARWSPHLRVGLVGDGNDGDGDCDVTICTFNGANKLVRIHDIAICDEAHHVFDAFSGGADVGKFATIIRDHCRNNNIPAILLSATLPPGNYDFSYSTHDAIRDGVLCDYKVDVPLFTLGDQFTAMVALIANQPAWLHILAFFNTNASAAAVVSLLNAAGVTAAAIHGSTSVVEKTRLLAEFAAGTLRVLASSRLVSEGVNMPIADTCIFVEGRCSTVDVNQCIGRVLRMQADKNLSTIVIPTTNIARELTRYKKLISRIKKRYAKLRTKRSDTPATLVTIKSYSKEGVEI